MGRNSQTTNPSGTPFEMQAEPEEYRDLDRLLLDLNDYLCPESQSFSMHPSQTEQYQCASEAAPPSKKCRKDERKSRQVSSRLVKFAQSEKYITQEYMQSRGHGATVFYNSGHCPTREHFSFKMPTKNLQLIAELNNPCFFKPLRDPIRGKKSRGPFIACFTFVDLENGYVRVLARTGKRVTVRRWQSVMFHLGASRPFFQQHEIAFTFIEFLQIFSNKYKNGEQQLRDNYYKFNEHTQAMEKAELKFRRISEEFVNYTFLDYDTNPIGNVPLPCTTTIHAFINPYPTHENLLVILHPARIDDFKTYGETTIAYVTHATKPLRRRNDSGPRFVICKALAVDILNLGLRYEGFIHSYQMTGHYHSTRVKALCGNGAFLCEWMINVVNLTAVLMAPSSRESIVEHLIAEVFAEIFRLMDWVGALIHILGNPMAHHEFMLLKDIMNIQVNRRMGVDKTLGGARFMDIWRNACEDLPPHVKQTVDMVYNKWASVRRTVETLVPGDERMKYLRGGLFTEKRTLDTDIDAFISAPVPQRQPVRPYQVAQNIGPVGHLSVDLGYVGLQPSSSGYTRVRNSIAEYSSRIAMMSWAQTAKAPRQPAAGAEPRPEQCPRTPAAPPRLAQDDETTPPVDMRARSSVHRAACQKLVRCRRHKKRRLDFDDESPPPEMRATHSRGRATRNRGRAKQHKSPRQCLGSESEAPSDDSKDSNFEQEDVIDDE